jgi:hypothetical protein
MVPTTVQRGPFFTAHEFALYIESLGATFDETSDTDESPMADGPTVLTDANGEE